MPTKKKKQKAIKTKKHPNRPKQEKIYVEISKSNKEVANRQLNPGKVKCLGWCEKEFLSPNRIYIRYCKKCKSLKDRAQEQNSLKVHVSAIAS